MAQGPARRTSVRVQAIGFAFGDEDERAPPRKASKISTIGTLASSLLVLSPVLKGAVAEAFLAALAVTQKYQAPNKDVLAAYAKFYNLLLTSGYDSWQDYILDQLLLGRDNSFARAVAQGNLEPGAPILRAVAYDLDVLQELSLPLNVIAEYVGDAAPTAGPYWLEGASSVSIKSNSKKLGSGSGGSGSGGSKQQQAIAIDPNTKVQFIQRPPSAEELREWKAAISNKERWSDAVPLLTQYYHLYGFGITSRNSTLRWSKGAFEEGPDSSGLGLQGTSATTTTSMPAPTMPATHLGVLEPARAALAANTLRHCEGLPAQHALVAGPSGSGKSWLLWDSTIAAARDKGLRVVEVAAGELHNVLEAARGCGRYPRLRFVIVADHVDFPLRGNLAADLQSGLAVGGPSGWPSNTLLYVGASASSTMSFDSVTSRFGLVLSTDAMTEDSFGQTLRELATGMAKTMGLGAEEAQAEVAQLDVADAAAWARKRGGLTVRNAHQYLRMSLS